MYRPAGWPEAGGGSAGWRQQCILKRLEPKAAFLHEVADVDPIGQKRFSATEVEPLQILLRIIEEVVEKLLVVAAKCDAAKRRWWRLQQVFQNAP